MDPLPKIYQEHKTNILIVAIIERQGEFAHNPRYQDGAESVHCVTSSIYSASA